MECKIAVLMACHNRRDKTLACIRSLETAVGRMGSLEATVFLVDDGSTDGTADAVANEFPDVRLISGDGTLYWAKGMRKAWEAAVAERGDCDGYLWLNDDVELDEDAMVKTIGAKDAFPDDVIVGALRDRASGRSVYGVGEKDLFTGSFVFVPQSVYEKVGMLFDAYQHAWADYDYAMMCRRAGVGCHCMDSAVGTIEAHPLRPSLKGLSLGERWRTLKDPKGWCLADLWTYRVRNHGVISAVASCMHMATHVLTAKE